MTFSIWFVFVRKGRPNSRESLMEFTESVLVNNKM